MGLFFRSTILFENLLTAKKVKKLANEIIERRLNESDSVDIICSEFLYFLVLPYIYLK